MAKTVLGLFDSFGEAQNAVEDLKRFGVRQEDISMVARDAQGDATGEQELDGAAEGAGAGAVGGSLVGGALGLLVGTGLLVIPGIGPVLAAGPLAAGIGTLIAAAGATALGAGLGAAAGGLLGGLMGAGVPEDEAQAYVEGVRRGGTLLSVGASDVEADDVRQILLRNGAVDMDHRSGEWRAAGWGSSAAADTGVSRADVGDGARREARASGDDWEESSKLGTTGGTVAGAATGAAIGAVGGPVGAVIGGIAGAATGAAAGATGDVAGERAEDGARREGRYDFKDGNLADVDRQVLDTSYTDVDRTGDNVKSSTSGYASGHEQPVAREPEAFGEFLADDERSFRTPDADTKAGAGSAATAALTGAATPYRGDGRNVIERTERTGDADLASESGRRSPRYAGADEMGGALSNMGAGSGSDQPGRVAIQPGASTGSEHMATLMSGEASTTQPSARPRGGARIYSSDGGRDAAIASEGESRPDNGDFARGMRDQPVAPVEPDFARGMHPEAAASSHASADAPHHGDFARGMRDEASDPVEPDFARGQRSFEQYDTDFVAHHQLLTGAGGQPYDYYKPGYQFGFDMANDRSHSHDSWERAEVDARQSWQSDARGSWEEFKQSIRYGWEKARGRA